MQNDYYNRDPQPFSGDGQGGFMGQMFGFPQMPPFGQGFQPPFGQGGQPFGQPPFGQPGGPPFGQPPGVGVSGTGPPSGPPPSFVPSQATAQHTQGVGAFAINPGAIRPCTFRFVYLWLDNGQQFWAWLVFVGRNSVAGWRWIGFRWVYFGIDLDRIVAFVCY